MLIHINPQDIQNFLKFKNKKILPITETSSSAIDALKKRHTGLIIDDQFIRVGKELANCPHVKGWHKDMPRSCNSTKKTYKQLHKNWYQEINDRRHKSKKFKQFHSTRLKTWDDIFNASKTNGYCKSDPNQDNVEVAVDRYGNYLLIEGPHRVAFAQILGEERPSTERPWVASCSRTLLSGNGSSN